VVYAELFMSCASNVLYFFPFKKEIVIQKYIWEINVL
jgi:hypothetical protein